MKKEASRQKVRITNIVFRSRRFKNLNESNPAKGASFGNTGRGPFRKNFVIPKDPVNKLNINVYIAKVIDVLLSPRRPFGKKASVVKMMQRVVST